MYRLTGFAGLLIFLALAYAFSTARRAIKLKTVLLGLGLQFALGIFVLRVEWGREALQWLGARVVTLLGYSTAGSSFVFGELGIANGKLGLVFAFSVLTTIIFVSALFALLYHWGIMQVIIRAVAYVMRLMGASGAESLDVAASIFVGQTEAPLTIRPFLSRLTRSELMTVMTAGMAHVSGGIMAAYIALLASSPAEQATVAKHILTAVVMTAPGTILIAKMLVPETEVPVTAVRDTPGAATAEKVNVDSVEMPKDANALGAIARGTTDGLHLTLNVAAMLVAFLALIALVNGLLGGTHNFLAAHGMAWFPASLEKIFGVLFSPVALIIGIPWRDCFTVGNLLGTRMVMNEMVAFKMMGAEKALLDPRSFTIATFALCGFANLSSIGIQIGGIGALAPDRRNDLARLGFRAMLAGTVANLMSACIVGILL
jgi:CNT family concentrative nucleoside transporter